jgi:hypothetical protein
MVDGSLVGLFYDTPTLAHQMPQASAVHHITVIPLTWSRVQKPNVIGHGIESMSQPENWKAFSSTAANVMRQALAHNLTLDSVSNFFESCPYPADTGLRQYIQRTISEIDGNRADYNELLELFERGATEGEILACVNTPGSMWRHFPWFRSRK